MTSKIGLHFLQKPEIAKVKKYQQQRAASVDLSSQITQLIQTQRSTIYQDDSKQYTRPTSRVADRLSTEQAKSIHTVNQNRQKSATNLQKSQSNHIIFFETLQPPIQTLKTNLKCYIPQRKSITNALNSRATSPNQLLCSSAGVSQQQYQIKKVNIIRASQSTNDLKCQKSRQDVNSTFKMNFNPNSKEKTFKSVFEEIDQRSSFEKQKLENTKIILKSAVKRIKEDILDQKDYGAGQSFKEVDDSCIQSLIIAKYKIPHLFKIKEPAIGLVLKLNIVYFEKKVDLTFYGSYSVQNLTPLKAVFKFKGKPTSIKIHPSKGYNKEDEYFYFSLESKNGVQIKVQFEYTKLQHIKIESQKTNQSLIPEHKKAFQDIEQKIISEVNQTKERWQKDRIRYVKSVPRFRVHEFNRRVQNAVKNIESKYQAKERKDLIDYAKIEKLKLSESRWARFDVQRNKAIEAYINVKQRCSILQKICIIFHSIKQIKRVQDFFEKEAKWRALEKLTNYIKTLQRVNYIFNKPPKIPIIQKHFMYIKQVVALRATLHFRQKEQCAQKKFILVFLRKVGSILKFKERVIACRKRLFFAIDNMKQFWKLNKLRLMMLQQVMIEEFEIYKCELDKNEGQPEKKQWEFVQLTGKAKFQMPDSEDLKGWVDLRKFNWQLAFIVLKAYLKRCQKRTFIDWLKYQASDDQISNVRVMKLNKDYNQQKQNAIDILNTNKHRITNQKFEDGSKQQEQKENIKVIKVSFADFVKQREAQIAIQTKIQDRQRQEFSAKMQSLSQLRIQLYQLCVQRLNISEEVYSFTELGLIDPLDQKSIYLSIKMVSDDFLGSFASRRTMLAAKSKSGNSEEEMKSFFNDKHQQLQTHHEDHGLTAKEESLLRQVLRFLRPKKQLFKPPKCVFMPSKVFLRKLIRCITIFSSDTNEEILQRFGFI